MAVEAVTRTKLTHQQITGFWGAWAGWTLDGMDSVIYALVLSPALTELLPKSGYKATPANALISSPADLRMWILARTTPCAELTDCTGTKASFWECSTARVSIA